MTSKSSLCLNIGIVFLCVLYVRDRVSHASTVPRWTCHFWINLCKGSASILLIPCWSISINQLLITSSSSFHLITIPLPSDFPMPPKESKIHSVPSSEVFTSQLRNQHDFSKSICEMDPILNDIVNVKDTIVHFTTRSNSDKSTVLNSTSYLDETSSLLQSPLTVKLQNGTVTALSPLVISSNNHPPRESHTVAANTSLFAMPLSMSTDSLGESFVPPRHFDGDIDWVSLYVIYVIVLVSEAARGLLLPSTWPYYQSLGGTKLTVGSFVASFSLGRMISTVPLGCISDNTSVGLTLAIASVVQVIGHFLYAVAPSLSFLYFSRIIVGLGSATMSVCRAHLARAVPAHMRTHHFAYLSALQFIGFAVLPGLGGILALLPEVKSVPFLPINGFTYPAYVLVFANIVCVFLIRKFYNDPPQTHPRSLTRASAQQLPRVPFHVQINGTSFERHSRQPFDYERLRGSADPTAIDLMGESESRGGVNEFSSPDVIALIVCLLVNMVFRGTIAEIETVSVPFLMEQYGVSYGTGSFFLSITGSFGLIVYISFKSISKRYSDRTLVIIGLSCILTGSLPLSIRQLSMHMHVAIYVFCLGLTWSLAFPIGQTAVLSLFSKIISGLPAGGFLGLFSASGSIARLTMAVIAGKLWSDFKRESVYFGILVHVSVTVIIVAMFYRRLVPNENCLNQ